MGVFYTSQRPLWPGITNAIHTALMTAPPATPEAVANHVTTATDALAQDAAPHFQPGRFIAALILSGALLAGAIWTAQHNLPDISKALMDSFTGFSGIVLGLLGGEAQKGSS